MAGQLKSANNNEQKTISSWVLYYDLDYCMGHFLIGANFFKLVELLTGVCMFIKSFISITRYQSVYRLSKDGGGDNSFL